jgi:NDP-sugar pyrophosphorylase family protein
MAGEGSRFRDKGYIFPKPFIEVNGEPMIATVIKNLNMPDARHIFLARRSHIEQYSLEEVISQHFINTSSYLLTKDEGAACTALLAEDGILCKELLSQIQIDIE